MVFLHKPNYSMGGHPKRGDCGRILESVLCIVALASARAQTDTALGYDSDDGQFRRNELDLSYCID